MTWANAKKAMTLSGIKHHPSLSYVLLCIGGGVTIATLYISRLAAFNPDVAYISFMTVHAVSTLAFLFFCGGLGSAWAAYYIGRLTFWTPDVSWKNGSVPYSNERVSHTDQIKFYSPTRDYAKEENPRPKY